MRKTDVEKWRKYFEARNDGHGVEAACRRSRISKSVAYAFERNDPKSSGLQAAQMLGVTFVAGNLVDAPLSEQASKALDDFAYFRLRYFGRKSTPWQVRAAYQILEAIESPEREYIVINVPPGAGKALALDTPLPTPTGWTTMRDVQPGDFLIGEHGQPVVVQAKTPVMYDRPCYEVRSDDGHSVIADAEHEWPTMLHGYGTYKPKRPDRPGRTGPKQRRQLHTSEFLAKPRSKRPVLPLAAPLDLPEAPLPVDPYILGVWLGDGASASGRISAHESDQPYLREQFEKAGYTTTDIAAPQAFGVLRLQTDLRHLGVLNDKHIPQMYLRGSAHQRMSLLQGLVDTDGHVDEKGRTEIVTVSARLADDIVELVASLGVKVSRNTGRAMLDGKDCGPKYRICFSLEHSARMPRKAHGRTVGRPRYLTVTEADSVPVACVQVDGGLYLCGEGMLLTHNSTLFTCDIPTWLIARDRTIRIQIGSRTERQARMYVTRIKRALEREAPLRADADSLAKGIAFDAEACLVDDYGAFRPEGRSDLWAANALVVRQTDQTQIDDKEPTLSAWGQDSGFLGGRFDFIIWDDLVDQRNTRTEEAREKSREWWSTEAETRLEPGGALVLQGQRIARNDLYRYALDQTTLDDHQKYRHIIYRAHDEALCTQQHDPRVTKPWPDGCLLDPYRIPWRTLEAAKRNNPRVFAVQYQQEDGDADGGLVDPAWITGGVDAEGDNCPGCLDRQRSRLTIPAHLTDGRGWSFVTVDPSPTEWWGIIWWVYDPDTNNRYIIDIVRRRLNPEQFLSIDMDTFEFGGVMHEMRKDSLRLNAPIRDIVFEVNAAQRWFLQQPHVQKYMDVTGVRFVPHTTSANKADPKFGVESVGDFFRQGRIRIPHADLSSRRMSEALTTELLAYPDGETDDLVMSTWFHTLAVTHQYTPQQKVAHRSSRPSWIGKSRGLAYRA